MRLFAALVALVTLTAGTAFASPMAIAKGVSTQKSKVTSSVVAPQSRAKVGRKAKKAHGQMAKHEVPKRGPKGRFLPRKKA